MLPGEGRDVRPFFGDPGGGGGRRRRTARRVRAERLPGDGEGGPSLKSTSVRHWYADFASWYPSERDTRGWDDTLGRLHAVAHGADAAAAFARRLPAERPGLLDLCARRMTAPHTDYRYAQLEDARLARAVTGILLAPGLTAEQAAGWLSVVTDALDGGGPGPVPPWAFNTFATLQALHLHLVRGLAEGGVPPHAGHVADRVAAVLRLPCGWLA
ncbi:DUF2785 domain-containing protein [Streptomyces sp. NPDC047980]|uniref:DUF2785 domain-containing protein n=1 Tax=unclassified Streptomyces TaxID=2593676 RepID=UPI00371DCBB8